MTTAAPTLSVVKVDTPRLAEIDYLATLARYVDAFVRADGCVVLVHGGGSEIARLHAALDVPFRLERGLRVTSDAAMGIVSMVLCGLVNKRVVSTFNAAGLRTLGICGADLGVMRANFLNYRQLGRVGGPPEIDAAAIATLLGTTDVLAVSPVCMAPDGSLLNVNADAVAQTLAVAIQASCLEFVTDAVGVPTADGTARSLMVDEVSELIDASHVGGTMIPKLQASLAALDGGVSRVRFGSLESLRLGTATVVSASAA